LVNHIFKEALMPNALLEDAEFLKKCRELTLTSYKGKIPDEGLSSLLEHMPTVSSAVTKSAANSLGSPGSVSAKVNVAVAFVYGTVDCTIDSLRKNFHAEFWGLGLAGFASTGIMYTAYDSWEAFFANSHGYHAQGGGAAAGVVQVTWFNGNGTPVGQYNGVAGGVGAFEVGGKGSWSNT
jgi:hypothetical protein